MTNIFSTRFDGPDTLADIQRLVTVHPDPVTGLEELSPALAAERLSEALKTIFLPNQFSLDFIKDSVDRARSFSAESFSTDQQYQRRLYHPPRMRRFLYASPALLALGRAKLSVG
ncbi:hypothetical protein SAMN04490202_2592 [Pseudomonas reinekei]|uniref:Uncharacterized protein n=1 Tax=Pseudomonas reinekei TaxID=395598 RepID=A0A1H0PBK3_PSERE|nr:hypothetical protein [Pseudomonas reinekei]SDP02029.1 hypothetical protein SAMN04490202_2592 [Pseudomonas reinekei]